MNGAEFLGTSIVEWISLYGYWFLMPVMIIEGTTVGFIAGALASLGVFNPFILFGVYVGIRFITDTFLYVSARHGSDYLLRVPVAKKVILKFRGEGATSELAHYIDRHFFRSLFLAKVLPVPTLDTALLIAAGTLKISAKRVYLAILTGQPIWSAMVIGLGFFFGDTIKNPGRVFNVIGFAIGLIIVCIVLYNKYIHNWVVEKTPLGALLKNNSIKSS